MEKLIKVMMQLIKSELCGKLDDNFDRSALSDDFLSRLYSLSKAHDLTHIVGSALKKNGLLPKNAVGAKFEKKSFMAIYRYEQLNYEFERICQTLETGGVVFVPLKGSVIRKYYPMPWMRTSCDIDILIKEEDIDLASSMLCKKLNYTAETERHTHDISLYSESGVHLELHFSLIEMLDNIDPLLTRVFDYCSPAEGKSFEYYQSPEFFVFHHVAHMSYHFLRGGCGVRPFIDTYLIREKLNCDQDVLWSMLKECAVDKFYEGIIQLTDVWFGNAEHTPLTRNMENYIISGGVYGTSENIVLLNNEKSGGKRKYFIKRIFMPYKDLKSKYPSLDGHRWLTPIYQIRRWFGLIFCGRLKRSVKELKSLQNISSSQAEALRDLLYELKI